MLRSEFEQRVNYKVTEEEFKSINEMYMDTDLDKDDFCLLYNASQFITQKVADVARERKQLREEKIQLGYWMADQFQKLGTMDLRNKAVELLGARNYLLYVLQKKYAITDEDRDLITSLIYLVMGDLKNELQKMLEELELRKKKLSSLDFKQNQYVVLFKPVKGEGDLYGVTKKPLNKISSDIQDVLPVPGLEIIKVMGYTEALLQASIAPSR